MQLDELVRMHARRARAYFKKHPEVAVYASKGTDHRVRVVRDGPQIVVCITPADASDYADPLVQETLYLCAPCKTSAML